ncbi:hypothetical protein BO82DRAFT_433811 [Aspergillus uvarum CBS 121591]|uniref:DUF6604 domain-containing protein n=1 Tax=Aspergillus uvarum CBS 121591 TaxID=1448315 RepID=A0A319CW35_9EURO|nr:hypothetical protein BO82DRAFT_433811 [Aspergillus uvarum CBS 121591]PYH79798.1 hypothetical protein BO82DRAFT_433811 [Aspergillus uvarum CBS 121591]
MGLTPLRLRPIHDLWWQLMGSFAARHIPGHGEFVERATKIVATRHVKEVPRLVAIKLRRSIVRRRYQQQYYEHGGGEADSNASHTHFIGVLKHVEKMLMPILPRQFQECDQRRIERGNAWPELRNFLDTTGPDTFFLYKTLFYKDGTIWVNAFPAIRAICHLDSAGQQGEVLADGCPYRGHGLNEEGCQEPPPVSRDEIPIPGMKVPAGTFQAFNVWYMLASEGRYGAQTGGFLADGMGRTRHTRRSPFSLPAGRSTCTALLYAVMVHGDEAVEALLEHGAPRTLHGSIAWSRSTVRLFREARPWAAGVELLIR